MSSACHFFVYIDVAKQKKKQTNKQIVINQLCTGLRLHIAADRQTLSLNIIFHFEIKRVMRVIEGKLDTVKMFYASFFRHVRYNPIQLFTLCQRYCNQMFALSKHRLNNCGKGTPSWWGLKISCKGNFFFTTPERVTSPIQGRPRSSTDRPLVNSVKIFGLINSTVNKTFLVFMLLLCSYNAAKFSLKNKAILFSPVSK